jgi:CheY-like chemotaxis protein
MAFHIVVVDDVSDLLDALNSISKPLHCELSMLGDSEEAARQLEGRKVDGVIVRLGAPHLNGIELIKRVRASSTNPRTPIVVVAVREDLDTIREGFRAGATVYLGQPVTSERAYGLLKFLRGPMSRERRRLARLPFRAPVECALGTSGGSHFRANSLNIGEGGMLLEPSGGLDIGDEIRMTFSMPRVDKPLRPRARIVRKELPDRIGIEFVEVSLRERDAIDSYITGLFKDQVR